MSTEMGFCKIHKRIVRDTCIECESEVYDQDLVNDIDFLVEMENNEDQMIHEGED